MVPNIEELNYLREQFVEATSLHGRLADFYQIDHIKWKNTDDDIIYKGMSSQNKPITSPFYTFTRSKPELLKYYEKK